MKGIIIFDTNFLVAHKGQIKEILNKIKEHDFSIFVPQIAMEEFINIQLRIYKQEYKQLEEWSVSKPLWNLKYNKEKDIIKNAERGYEKLFEESFGENIIHYDKETILSDVLERNKFKDPPFINEPGSSDKGFKDTIMWISIKQFIKAQEEKIDCFLITSDNGFIKYQEKLEKEIKNVCFKIVDVKDVDKLYEKLGFKTETNGENTNVFQKDLKATCDISYIRERINYIMDKFIKYEFEDWNGEVYVKKRFKIYTYINDRQTEIFLNRIPTVLSSNIFRKSICVESFFSVESEVYSEGVDIEIEIVSELNELYELIKDTEYKAPFITFVMQKINENREFKPKDDDLPF